MTTLVKKFSAFNVIGQLSKIFVNIIYILKIFSTKIRSKSIKDENYNN